MDYIDIKKALEILKSRGIKISAQLFHHYCTTGREPEGTEIIAGRRVYTEEGIRSWRPVAKRLGRPRNV